MKSVTVIGVIAIKLLSIVLCASETNSSASNVLPMGAQTIEPVFSSGFIRYAADGVFTGFCPLCHTLIQDDERIFAFHALSKGNISRHLYHSKCLYSNWKKNAQLVGRCPSCRKLNPNIGPVPRERNHACICVLADTLSVDVVDARFSKWIPNYHADNVHEVIREFIAAADAQQKRQLIFPFIKTMLKKKIMKNSKEQHVVEIIKNLDSMPEVQKEALIEWRYEVLKALESVPESGNSATEAFDTPIPEVSKYIVAKLNKQVVINSKYDNMVARVYYREAKSISKKNSYIYMQNLSLDNIGGEDNPVESLLLQTEEFLHSEDAATALIRRYPWERIGSLFSSPSFTNLAMETRNYNNLIWFCLNQRSNFEMYQTFCPFVCKFSSFELLKNFKFSAAKEEVCFVKELLNNVKDDAILIQLITAWYTSNDFPVIITNFHQVFSRIKCPFANAALAYYFLVSFVGSLNVLMHNEMAKIIAKCNFPSVLMLKKRVTTLELRNFHINGQESDSASNHFLPLVHHYDPQMNLIELLEQFENVAQQWMPFFHEIIYVAAILATEDQREAFEQYIYDNSTGKRPLLTEKQIDFIRSFDLDFGKLSYSPSLMMFLKRIIQRVPSVKTLQKK